VGKLHLQVPQARDGSFTTQLFARYQRSEKALCLALMETVIQGVSTRRVEAITRQLCGTDFSAATISNLTQQLDADLAQFRNRDLSGNEYPYLLVDARYEKVRQHGQVVDQAMLLIVGINASGYREIVAIEVAHLESESTWGEVFKRLAERGLRGVKLVVSDDHKGIKAAVARFFTGCLWQRCRVHFLRNLMGLVCRKERKRVVQALHFIWTADSLTAAQRRIKQVVTFYQERYPELATAIEEGTQETLAVFALPESQRKKLATTNCVERLSQSIKQRTRVVRIFPNRHSCLRLVTAILQEIHEDWSTGYRYLELDLTERKEVDEDMALSLPREVDEAFVETFEPVLLNV
jgi:transposase-like protein